MGSNYRCDVNIINTGTPDPRSFELNVLMPGCYQCNAVVADKILTTKK